MMDKCVAFKSFYSDTSKAHVAWLTVQIKENFETAYSKPANLLRQLAQIYHSRDQYNVYISYSTKDH